MLNSLTLLRAMNGIHEEDVVMAGNSYFDEKQVKHFKTKRIISFALAAALILSLGIAAYAAFSSMTHRVPKKSETFRISWEEGPTGYVEWSDAKLAVTFPEKAESKEIEFRPSYLPDEMASLKDGSWRSRLTAEKLAFSGPPQSKIPAYQDMMQPLLIETYYMSQFSDGGALLLLYYTPEEIIEEHWDELGVDVMRFHCTEHFDARPEIGVDEYTLEQDIILLSDADAGWVVRVCGEIGMDQLVKVARNLEIRETGKVLTCDDFEGNHFAFMDGGVG